LIRSTFFASNTKFTLQGEQTTIPTVADVQFATTARTGRKLLRAREGIMAHLVAFLERNEARRMAAEVGPLPQFWTTLSIMVEFFDANIQPYLDMLQTSEPFGRAFLMLDFKRNLLQCLRAAPPILGEATSAMEGKMGQQIESRPFQQQTYDAAAAAYPWLVNDRSGWAPGALAAARQAARERMALICEKCDGLVQAGPVQPVRQLSAFEWRFTHVRPTGAVDTPARVGVTPEAIAMEFDAHERDPFPSLLTGAPREVAEAVAAVPDGDLMAYIQAVKPYRPLIARLLLVLGAQPICTALLEGSFSVAGWLDDPRRSRFRSEVLRAQTILACNRALTTDSVREIAREFLKGRSS
jgi:hypothetical protein